MRKFILNVTIFIFLLSFLSSFFVATAATENTVDYICPPNSYLKDGLCHCNEGLVWNEEVTECITYNQSCQSEYGLHAYGDANYCYCEDGYVWNKGKTKCITSIEWCFSVYNDEHMEAYKEGDEYKCKCIDGYVWNEERTKCITPDEWCFDIYNDEHITARKEGDSCQLYCHCVDGYVWHDELKKCITHTENCRLTYGEHVVGRDDEKCWSYCDCEEGYAWNLSKSQCIPKFKAFVEYFTHFNLLAFILGLIPISIWFLVLKLITKFVFKTKLSIKKSLIFFGAGMVITPFVWFIENYFINLLQININTTLPLFISAFVYLGIAGIEELAKFFSAALVLRKNKYFDEAINVMIYLIVLALGFVVVENYLVTYQEFVSNGRLLPTFQIITLRFIGVNLLHVLSSGIIGFFWALKLVSGKKRYLGIGLILGILLHWAFNIALIILGGDAVFLATIILITLLVAFFYSLKKLSTLLQKHLT